MMSVVLMLSMGVCSSVSYARDMNNREAMHKALTEIRQNISVSREQASFLARQVDSLKKDQRTLTDELIKVAKAERDVANYIADREKKLKKLIAQQVQVRQNLKSRCVEFSEVLAVLEKMGLNPPPALMVRPDDVLTSIRSSVLLGAIIPEMQERTLSLMANLRKLTSLSNSITAEYTALKIEVQDQAKQRKHLELLLNEKAKLQKRSEEELIEQRQRNIALAKKAQSLEELILELDHQSRSYSPTQLQKNLQLFEQFDFESRKGHLFLPVVGKRIKRLNNSSHATRFGEMIETEPEAVVTAPADAVVAFAGLFRSYGQLVILNVGRGYHIILIGMAKVNVTQGQIVLSGEPLGTMGAQSIANTVALDIGKSTPVLYIEFRKWGKSVNPTLWWRTEKTKRNQNDS
ncbi:murein hydrolase activator EnvC family protein [Bartonella sp. A05]|uniref:murein hydrolase activator EnvC family protein n=1 Tax=Bartonella sp. A05 TaxID=2967261 RepID=UPI0022A8FF56|nr:peptidoglycan DD-metalloendopeptidase family protein [Bartonella sp. A05]MCZ2203956.1 peptidoglycan DD-metalloendopeptidase family protein [Bartonella sp. A05]